MKYFTFFISTASIITGLAFIILYFTDTRTDSRGDISYSEAYLLFSAIGFVLFLFTSFYLWKNNFFKPNP